ncbi:MAG: flagellar cap protein FliD N-terminal domain-containing protein [Spirochaetota bacterium]
MSDISIPGVSSKFNTDKIIDGLMEIQRVPLTRMEERVNQFKDQKNIWQDINRAITRLDDSAKKLYGFQNPFQEKTASSSDENIFTATASREAQADTKEITVKQTAKADRFLSNSLSKDFTVPEGDYGFSLGGKEITFKFRGGNLTEFADTVNRRTENLVKARIVQDTPDTQVLLIESTKTGKKNTLFFQGDSIVLGEKTGILEKSVSLSYQIMLNEQALRPWNKPLNEQMFRLTEGVLEVPAGGEVSIPLLKPVDKTDKLVLDIEYAVQKLQAPEYLPPSPPPGPNIPVIEGINFEEISINNIPSQVDLPPWEQPAPPKKIDDLHIFFLQNGGEVTQLPEVKDSTGPLPHCLRLIYVTIIPLEMFKLPIYVYMILPPGGNISREMLFPKLLMRRYLSTASKLTVRITGSITSYRALPSN